MPGERQASDTSSPATATLEPTLSATVVRVAWLSVLLGLFMEILILIISAGFGFSPGLKTIIADFAGQVSWSVFVCVGLAFGTIASKLRVQLMGFLGLLSAPIAFNIARIVHQGIYKALQIAGPASESFSLLLPLSVLKGVEYACLGVAIGWLGRRHWGGALAHMATGLLIGVLFGILIVGLTYWGTASFHSEVEIISRSVNEVLFPVGCSLVLYSAEVLGKKVTSDEFSAKH